jgi:thymidine phosphorylase
MSAQPPGNHHAPGQGTDTQKARRRGAGRRGEIAALVTGVCDGSVSDAQIAAFAMATWFRGMTLDEQMALTLAMRDSGRVLHWDGLDGPVLDKHSTGGVGDLVSLVLGPVIAACGGYVPMISGRGLGHTGGTLDKLESIPGFETAPGFERMQRLVREQGLAIVGQSAELVPADRRVYAVRDVTATVSSTPLIVSSILSKKLAEGLDALVMDVKCGGGAVSADLDTARGLAAEICRVSRSAGLPCSALVTDMDQPLAWSAGNALEVLEAVRFLRGDSRNERVLEVVLALCAELLRLGGLAGDEGGARALAQAALDSGRAAEKFARMVSRPGRPVRPAGAPAGASPASRGGSPGIRRSAGLRQRHRHADFGYDRGGTGRRPSARGRPYRPGGGVSAIAGPGQAGRQRGGAGRDPRRRRGRLAAGGGGLAARRAPRATGAGAAPPGARQVRGAGEIRFCNRRGAQER